jgi:hypothetical protein
MASGLAFGCGERSPGEARKPAAQARPGIRFDPGTIRKGAVLGHVRLDSIVRDRAVVADSSWVGIARFTGELTLAGRVIPHFDSDMHAVCFEADTVSGATMPRWEGDERRPWFCFENQVKAERLLGKPGVEFPATVAVDAFTIHHGFSDQVNSARLVRVVSRGGD